MINIFGFKLKKQRFILLLLVAILVFLLPFIIYVAQKSQDIRNQAIEYFTFQADPSLLFNIYFDPIDIILTGETPVKIMANMPGNTIAFARVVFIFDPAKIQLSNDITPGASLTTTVENTPFADINSSGRAVVVVAASTTDIPVTGNFEIASFSIVPAVGAGIEGTSMMFDTADMQIVDNLGTVVTLNPGNANITFAGTTVVPTEILPTTDPNITDAPIPTVDPNITSDPNLTITPSGQPNTGGDNDNDDDGNQNGSDDDDDNDGTKDSIDTDVTRDINKDGVVNLKDLGAWILNLFI